MTNLGAIKAKQEASKIIEQFGIIRPEHIRVKDIAVALGVTNVIEGSLDSAAASLVTIGNQTIIRISDSETNTGRQRFSIGHELGHFVLGHGHTLHKICSDREINSWYGGGEEVQANTFAAELLLP
jgi:Zn-dependent peptidase ImmA (M78 family)